MSHPSTKWNNRYRSIKISDGTPSRVLEENAHLLPKGGRALDLACGLGANALLLAKRGLNTSAWDVSEVVIAKLQAYAEKLTLGVRAQVRDVESYPPAENSFDVIVVSRFLERSLVPRLIKALKPNGLIFYQTFTQDAVNDTGPSSLAYRLKPNELLIMFRPLRILVYREEGTVGDTRRGFRDEAMLIGLKE